MQVIARNSQAACHCFLTVRRVGMVAARRSTALRFTRSARTDSRSSGAPGLRTGRRCTSTSRSSPITGGRAAGGALAPANRSVVFCCCSRVTFIGFP